MKRVMMFWAMVMVSLSVFAQAGNPPSGRMPEPPAIGVVFGKLADSTGKAVNDASVILMGQKFDTTTKKFKEVLLRSAVSKGSGSFRFEDLPIIGELTLKISATGYKAVEKKFSFVSMPKPGAGGFPSGLPAGPPPGGMPSPGAAMPNFSAASFEKDLGRISMTIEATELQNITIVASKPGMKMDIDKKVFNVEKNIVSAGGTAVDLMKNVPSVNVDIDGNVTLRNATPQLYIDGRPTTLTLDQIPADAIESVEVITNPSAKYDASGGNAGILNIILKKNKKSGYNGNVNLGVDKRGGINGGAGINIRQDKFNFSLNGFTNQMRQQTKSETHQVDLLSNPNLLVDQYSKTRAGGGFIFGKAGLDYFATDRLTVSAGLVRVHGSMTPTEFMVSDSSWSNGNYQSYSEREARTNRSFNATGFQAGFKQLFKKQGEELTGDVNIFSGKSNYGQAFDTYVYGAKGGVQTGEQFQKIMGNGSTTFTTIQTDYVRPTKTGGKLEAGLRAQLRQMENFQANYFMDGSGSYVKVPSSNTNYENKDNVYAAYLSYSGKVKNFGYKLGLRGESSNYSATLTETNEYFSNKYPISLFPSIFLSQKLKNSQDLQMSYTRRINRPFFMQQIPFIDSSNQLNWTRGNAGLKPEFTNSLEASYSKTYKGNNMFLASVYFKYTTGLITTILDTVQVNGISHPITTYENANSSYMTGFELTSQNYFTKWWDMNTNLNIYNSKINANDLGINTDAMWSWFAKFNSNFKMPKNYTVQLSGTYQSKTNTPVNSGGGGFGPPGFGGSQATAQGYIKANWGIDLALKKSFLKNNAASVTFSVTDIFRTRFTQQYTYSSFFTREQTRWPDNPMFRINFSYRFGKMDMNLFKRKNMKQEGESMNGVQM